MTIFLQYQNFKTDKGERKRLDCEENQKSENQRAEINNCFIYQIKTNTEITATKHIRRTT
jgi:hypothetical protein